MRRILTKKRVLIVIGCLAALVMALAVVGALREGAGHPSSSASGSSAAHGMAAVPALLTPNSQAGANAQSNSVPSFTAATDSQAGRYLVRSGTLDLTVAKGQVPETASRVTALATVLGGYVVSSELSSSGSPPPYAASTPLIPTEGGPYADVVVAVPAASFEQAITAFSALGHLQDLSTQIQDVTGQYVDLAARLAHYQAVEQRLLGFLARTTTVGEALAVQERIDSTELSVEELTSELKALRSTVVYSTLTVSIQQKAAKPVAVAADSFPRAFVHSLALVWAGAQAAIVGIGAALPFAALATLLGWAALVIVRRTRRAHMTPGAEA
jgi:hypothetical protein